MLADLGGKPSWCKLLRSRFAVSFFGTAVRRLLVSADHVALIFEGSVVMYNGLEASIALLMRFGWWAFGCHRSGRRCSTPPDGGLAVEMFFHLCDTFWEFLISADERFAVDGILNAVDFHDETVDAVVEAFFSSGQVALGDHVVADEFGELLYLAFLFFSHARIIFRPLIFANE